MMMEILAVRKCGKLYTAVIKPQNREDRRNSDVGKDMKNFLLLCGVCV